MFAWFVFHSIIIFISTLKQVFDQKLRNLQTARINTGGRPRDHRRLLSADARPFVTAINSDGSSNPNEHLNPHQQQLGERLYPKVSTFLFPE